MAKSTTKGHIKPSGKDGKTKVKPSAPAQDAVTSIDDIFARPKPSAESKSKTPAPKPAAAGSASAAASRSKTSTTGDKPKKKKNKVAASFNPEAEVAPASAPSRVVEVVDPSLPKPVPTEVAAPSTKKGKSKRDRGDTEADEAFKDSRGDGPRRKTEEGFLIYKEAELAIDPEAGGTPLCPFDCDCCF